MTIKDVRSIIEHDRDIWKTRASGYKMCAETGSADAITRFYDAMSNGKCYQICYLRSICMSMKGAKNNVVYILVIRRRCCRFYR